MSTDHFSHDARRFRERPGVRKEKNFRRAENPYECWDNPEDETAEHREDLTFDLAIAYNAPLPTSHEVLGCDERLLVRRPRGWWKQLKEDVANALSDGHDELEQDLAT